MKALYRDKSRLSYKYSDKTYGSYMLLFCIQGLKYSFHASILIYYLLLIKKIKIYQYI